MVHGCVLVPVLARRPLMLKLGRRGLYMMFIGRLRFRRRRPGSHPAGTTIVADPVVDGCIVDHCPVNIGIMHDCRVHMGHRSIVLEMPADPAATDIADTTITTTVIHPAIEPDMRSPVPAMPPINTTGISPVSRRP